jgi:hypothetical protein
MSFPEQPASLSSLLGSLAQRLGLAGRSARQILERASSLQLPFQALPKPEQSIWWESGPPLQRLLELPRDALSGPVQEDKAQAHAVLRGLIKQRQEQRDNIDLRLISGFSCTDSSRAHCSSFEQYAASAACQQIRIISYKDFVKTISLALPRFLGGEPISLRQANWHGEQLYWSGEQNLEAFACAIAYARRRGLEISLPAQLTHYQIDPTGLAALHSGYHMLAMPVQTWSDPAFMALLLDHGLPYARLSLLRSAGAPEFLLLPKADEHARALGDGLRLAGAPDVVSYLQHLKR